MSSLPWIPLSTPEPGKEYIAVVTYLPLRSLWAMPQFWYYTRRIRSQLRSARGLVGYAILSHVLAKRFWTLSVWENEIDMTNFVHKHPHSEAMLVLRRFMGGTAFVRWRVNGSSVPPSWQEAMDRSNAQGVRGEEADDNRE